MEHAALTIRFLIVCFKFFPVVKLNSWSVVVTLNPLRVFGLCCQSKKEKRLINLNKIQKVEFLVQVKSYFLLIGI